MDFYKLVKFLSLFSRNRKEFMANYFRKKGIKIGDGCNITCNITSSEKFLIEIGNNVTISEDVLFLTHDASIGKIMGKENGSDLFGRIIVGDNCFIGARSVLLYGVTLPPNTIVAAGSVVTKSLETGGLIIGGNPARVISSTDRFLEKSIDHAFKVHGIKGKKLKSVVNNSLEKLVER